MLLCFIVFSIINYNLVVKREEGGKEGKAKGMVMVGQGKNQVCGRGMGSSVLYNCEGDLMVESYQVVWGEVQEEAWVRNRIVSVLAQRTMTTDGLCRRFGVKEVGMGSAQWGMCVFVGVSGFRLAGRTFQSGLVP